MVGRLAERKVRMGSLGHCLFCSFPLSSEGIFTYRSAIFFSLFGRYDRFICWRKWKERERRRPRKESSTNSTARNFTFKGRCPRELTLYISFSWRFVEDSSFLDLFFGTTLTGDYFLFPLALIGTQGKGKEVSAGKRMLSERRVSLSPLPLPFLFLSYRLYLSKRKDGEKRRKGREAIDRKTWKGPHDKETGD